MFLAPGRSFALASRQAFVVLASSALFVTLSFAQASKRPLTFQDFDSWRLLQGQQISRDGKWVAYVMQAEDGDGDVYVKSTTGDTEYKAPRGYHPPAPPPDASDPEATAAFQASGRLLRPRFSADSKYAFFNIEPPKDVLLKAKRDKKKPEEMPKNALGIIDLATGQVTRIDDVKNYQVPEDGSGYVAILKEAAAPQPAETPGAGANTTPEKEEDGLVAKAQQPPAQQTRGARGPRKEYGTPLILRRLADGSSKMFPDVLDYTFAKDGRSIVFSVASRKDANNGAFVVTPGSDAAPAAILAGPGKYTKFTWDEKQTQLGFISDKDDAAAKQPRFKVYWWQRGAPAAAEIVSPKSAGFRPEFVVSDKGSLAFSYDGSRLFVSSAPPADTEPDPANAPLDEEKVSVDLWHWKDDYVQSVQKVRAIPDRDRSYRGVYHIKEGKFVQLADASMENVNPNSDGSYAIGTDNRAYRIQSTWEPGYDDYYLVNTLDGSRKQIGRAQQFGMSWSVNGKYIVYFDGKDWNSISIPDMKTTNLTSKLNTKFAREDHDTPSPAPSYGLSGWTKDDKDVLINDHFDVWQIAPDGSSAKNLTGGMGRREKTVLRPVRLDPDERSIDLTKPVLLSADNEETRDSGFYRLNAGGAPEKLLMEAKNYGNPMKAKDADVLMFSATRFDMFPDVWVSSMDFRSPKRLSNGDAQRTPYAWGSSELIHYKSKDGVALEGVLIKPGNFDPSKKYPMMVYLYEKLSDTVHNFANPSPGTSVNLSFYASNGYVIFLPDIVYKTGYPGKSALNCVLPGVDAVVARGFVDEKNIGIQGHSWGGYQIAYMVTQTNRFKAAAPGALVANMFSAYNGIRWGTGLPRQFQYEHTQSRIGVPIWDAPDKYMENSPLFYVKNVETPILMIANDNDDAVPWYQGIEFYLSLRRLNKEVYFFSYNGEFHGLRRRADQKDYTRRMKEYFDHFLKGALAPEWMQKGIPYLQKEKEKEQYRQPIGDKQQ